MDKALIEKFVEMIIHGGVFLKKNSEDKLISLHFEYNREKDVIECQKKVINRKAIKWAKHGNYHLVSLVSLFYNPWKEKVSKFYCKNVEDVMSIVKEHDCLEQAERKIKDIIRSELRLEKVKLSLIQKVEKMNLNEEDKKVILDVIVILTRSEFPDRIYLVSRPGYTEHVRLADKSMWNNEGDDLHLQIVKRMETDIPPGHLTDYPDLSFEEVVDIILKSLIIRDEIDRINHINNHDVHVRKF